MGEDARFAGMHMYTGGSKKNAEGRGRGGRGRVSCGERKTKVGGRLRGCKGWGDVGYTHVLS